MGEISGWEFELSYDFQHLHVPVLEWLTLGFNYAKIESEVKRLPNLFDALAVNFADGENLGFGESRRLYQQPEWTMNAYSTVNIKEFGLSATLSYVAQSDVLEASAGLVGGISYAYPDIFQKSYGQLNFVLSKEFLPGDWMPIPIEGLTMTFSAQNLTDSTRGTVYADYAGGGARSIYKVGRTYAISASLSF